MAGNPEDRGVFFLNQENRGSVPAVSNSDSPSIAKSSPVLQLTMNDVIDELEYWKLGIVAYTIGSNPNVSTFTGFCKRIWGESNVDKVILLRFESKSIHLQARRCYLFFVKSVRS